MQNDDKTSSTASVASFSLLINRTEQSIIVIVDHFLDLLSLGQSDVHDRDIFLKYTRQKTSNPAAANSVQLITKTRKCE